MAAPDAEVIRALLAAFQNVEIAKFTAVATAMLSVYDYFITLSDEIFLVWPSHWGVSKVLFFLNRYFVFVDQALIIYVLLIGSEPAPCVRVFQATGATTAFGFVVAQVILMMRTWAIWGRAKWLTILLVALFVGAIAVDIYILPKYLHGISAVLIDRTLIPYKGCLIQYSNRDVYVDFIIVIVLEIIMLILLIIKAFEHFQHSRSRLMVRMVKDGVVYFVFIMLSSIANLVAILIAPVELHNFLIMTQRVLHSICCTRVLLHIRGAYANNGFADTTTGEGPTIPYFRPSGNYQGQTGRGTNAFELGSIGANVSAGIIEGGDGSGWGMGYGFGGKREVDAERARERERRRGSADVRIRPAGNHSGARDANVDAVGEGDGDKDDDKKTPTSSTFSPFCDDAPYPPELGYAAGPEYKMESGEPRAALASHRLRIKTEGLVPIRF